MDSNQPLIGTGWRHWCHVMGNTYGTWLPGDDRGFRTRHHRDHVQGDYKQPPPEGKYRKEQAASQHAMKRPPVILTIEQRRLACRAMVERLLREQVEVVEWVVTEKHFHGLARFTPWIDATSESPGMPEVPGIPESPGMAMPGLSEQLPSPPTTPRLIPPPRVSPRHGPLHKRPVQIDPRPRQMVGLAKKHASHIARENGMGVDGGLWAVRCKVEPIRDRRHQLNVVQYLRDHVEEGGVLWSIILSQMTEEEKATLGNAFEKDDSASEERSE